MTSILEKSKSFRDLKTITGYAGLALVFFLLTGPIIVVLARMLVRILPLPAFVGAVTSYSPARIRSENIRIVTEGGDYLFFILLLILVGITILTFLFVLSSFGDKVPPIKQLLSRSTSAKYLYPVSLILVFFTLRHCISGEPKHSARDFWTASESVR